MQKGKKHTGFIITLRIIALLVIIAVGTAGIYSHFGGFGTGECADTEEFAKYAAAVSELTVPDEAQIVALGEATHGNKEFQQLRLDVLQVLVEKYGVRSFALEGDFGGCEAVNRYIHGGDGTATAACAAPALNKFCSICTAFRCLHRIGDRPRVPAFWRSGGIS